jgi:hypothetical protein
MEIPIGADPPVYGPAAPILIGSAAMAEKDNPTKAVVINDFIV